MDWDWIDEAQAWQPPVRATVTSAGQVLLDASVGCLQMICAYYSVPTLCENAQDGVRDLMRAGISLEAVVNQHLPLLHLDQAMHNEAKAIDGEIRTLADELQREETYTMVQRIAWYRPRLRIYRQIACALCSSFVNRTDLTFVRVWSKSVTVRLSGHPHPPQRERLHFSEGYLVGLPIRLSPVHLSHIARELQAFHSCVVAALPLAAVLQQIVIPYVGPSIYILPDGVVEFDFD